ncbi:MAG: hypothetical protein WAM14_19160 [Candidatus Nitrosopolaris sp.]
MSNSRNRSVISRWYEFNLEICIFDLNHPIPAGISNDPTNAVAMTVNNEAQYSAGTGGGIRPKVE